MTTPGRLDAAFDREMERLRRDYSDPGKRMEVLAGRLGELAQERERAQELAVRGSLRPDELDAQLSRIQDERSTIEEQLAGCRDSHERIAALEALRDSLFIEYAMFGPEMVDTWPPEKRHDLYKQLGLKVLADPQGGIQMEWSFMGDAEGCGVGGTTP